jgi:hypothetical protein
MSRVRISSSAPRITAGHAFFSPSSSATSPESSSAPILPPILWQSPRGSGRSGDRRGRSSSQHRRAQGQAEPLLDQRPHRATGRHTCAAGHETRNIGLPIFRTAADKPTDRFQFGSRIGPPLGAGNSQSPGARSADHLSMIGTSSSTSGTVRDRLFFNVS